MPAFREAVGAAPRCGYDGIANKACDAHVNRKKKSEKGRRPGCGPRINCHMTSIKMAVGENRQLISPMIPKRRLIVGADASGTPRRG